MRQDQGFKLKVLLKILAAIFMLICFTISIWPSRVEAPEPQRVVLETFAEVHNTAAERIGWIYRYPTTGQCWLSTSEGVGEIDCP